MIGKVFAPLATVLLLQLQSIVKSEESAYDHVQVFQEDEVQPDVCMLQMNAVAHKPDQLKAVVHQPDHGHVRDSMCQNSTNKGHLETRKQGQGHEQQHKQPSMEAAKALRPTSTSGNYSPPSKVTAKLIQQEPAENSSAASEEATPAPATEEATAAPASGEEAPAPATEEATAAPASGEEVPAPATEEATAAPASGEKAPAPATEEATAAPASGEEAPAPASEGRPDEPEGEAAPAAESTANETAPAAEGEAAPAAEGEAAPAAEGEAAPAAEGEAAPAAEGEAAPAAESAANETAPAAESTANETAPAAEGEAVPAAEGEAKAATEGEAAPAAEGEAATAAEGEAAPAAEGEAAAAAEGEAAAAPADEAATSSEGEEAAAGEAAASEAEASEGGAKARKEEEELEANAAPPVPERPDVSEETRTNEDKFKEHFAEIANEIKEAKIVTCVLLAMIFVFMVVHIMHEYDIHILPEGVAIILCGVVLGLILKWGCKSRFMFDAEYRSEISIQMLNEVFLPMLMLEAGWSVRRMDFISQLPYILIFAVLGTLISTGVIAFLLYKTGQLGFHQITTLRGSFVIASLISATDPVSTLGTYSDLRVDPLLNIIVFGEAAINDAVAIVVFSLVNDDYYMGSMTSTGSMIALGACKGLRTLTCSFALGGGTSLLVCGCLRLVGMHRNKKLEILVVVLGGYLSYAVGEYFRVSGIICTLFNGMFLGKYAKFHLSTEGTMLTSFFISQMSTIMDSGVFLLSGVCCISLSTSGKTLGIFLMVFCVIARICSTIPCGLISNFMKWSTNRNPHATDEDLHILTSKYLFMIWHAGLRGGIAENLALQIGEWLDATNGPGSKESVRSAVFFLVATYIVVFGGTTKMFLQCFGISMGSSYDQDILSRTEMSHSQAKLVNWLHTKVFFPLLVGTVVQAQNADAVEDVGDNDVLAVLHEVCHGHRGGTMRKKDPGEMPPLPPPGQAVTKKV